MLLTELDDQPDQLTVLIPTLTGDFLGKAITLSVLKLHEACEQSEQGRLSQGEKSLLEMILKHLRTITSTIASHIASEITPNEPTFLAHAHEGAKGTSLICNRSTPASPPTAS